MGKLPSRVGWPGHLAAELRAGGQSCRVVTGMPHETTGAGSTVVQIPAALPWLRPFIPFSSVFSVLWRVTGHSETLMKTMYSCP